MGDRKCVKVLYPSINKTIKITFQDDVTIMELTSIVDEIVSSLTLSVDALVSITNQINYQGKFINIFINLNFDVCNDFDYHYKKAMRIVDDILAKYQM